MKNVKNTLTANGLTARCNREPNFALQVRLIQALAFVPIKDVEDAFYALSIQCSQELIPMLESLEDSYKGRLHRRGRHPPLFPLEMWNVYDSDRVIQNMDITNDHVEAVLRRVQAELKMDSPTIWKLIDGLKRVQKARDAFHEHLVVVNPLPRKSSCYGMCGVRILRVLQRCANCGVIEYLREIGHNFQKDELICDVFSGYLCDCEHILCHCNM